MLAQSHAGLDDVTLPFVDLAKGFCGLAKEVSSRQTRAPQIALEYPWHRYALRHTQPHHPRLAPSLGAPLDSWSNSTNWCKI
jgi:hypothetical protein